MKIYFILLIIFIFNGCSISDFNQSKNIGTNFKSLTYKLTTNLCSKIEDNSTLYMTDFVNEKNLKNRSQLGFLLSNELKVNIMKDSCTNNIAFKSLQLSNSMMSNHQGSRILTRNFKQLKVKNLKDNRQILVGSYIITNKQLILFVKLISLNNNNILATTSSSTLINDEIRELDGINIIKPQPYIYKPLHL